MLPCFDCTDLLLGCFPLAICIFVICWIACSQVNELDSEKLCKHRNCIFNIICLATLEQEFFFSTYHILFCSKLYASLFFNHRSWWLNFCHNVQILMNHFLQQYTHLDDSFAHFHHSFFPAIFKSWWLIFCAMYKSWWLIFAAMYRS